MRVEVAIEPESPERLEIPWQSDSAHFLDLRNNLRSIYQIEPARHHPPLGRFLAAVNSDDSVFSTTKCTARAEDLPDGGPEPHRFSSRIWLVFQREESNFEQSHFEGLAGQLERLLLRDSPADSLAVELRVRPARFVRLQRDGFHLLVRLAAEGATAEQAELRWGFGLARLQQALLFLSRVVRHHLRERSAE